MAETHRHLGIRKLIQINIYLFDVVFPLGDHIKIMLQDILCFSKRYKNQFGGHKMFHKILHELALTINIYNSHLTDPSEYTTKYHL